MKKTICDICGSDCSDDEYILPYYNKYYFDKLETRKFNLCDNCKRVIADTIKTMKSRRING